MGVMDSSSCVTTPTWPFHMCSTRKVTNVTMARLMIEHGAGVSTATTYEVKKIDFDYFVEDGA